MACFVLARLCLPPQLILTANKSFKNKSNLSIVLFDYDRLAFLQKQILFSIKIFLFLSGTNKCFSQYLDTIGCFDASYSNIESS